jgi:hypothetical protein
VWDYVPAWNGYLDIWGIGQFGTVPTSQMKALQTAGERLWFTTDGQMCIDTPYCAIERLLPHIAFSYDVEAYEFWGVDWLSDYDPYQFGWHSPVLHVFNPAEESQSVIYPNGDGYLVYPGAPVGQDRAIPTIRLAQAREGLEDYELLRLLKEKSAAVRSLGVDVVEAEKALQRMGELVAIPGPSGRYSTLLLPDPDALYAARAAAGAAVEKLEHVLQNPPGLPPPGSVPSLIFPQFVNGTSLHPTRQGSGSASVLPNRTRIILRNNSAHKDFGKLVFRNPAGVPVAVSINGISKEAFDYWLGPWGTLDIQTDGTGPLQSGIAELYSGGGGESRLEGTLVYDLLGEFVSVPGSLQTCFERVYAGIDGQERAALALYNPSPGQSIRLYLDLKDRQGKNVARRSVELAPLGQVVAFLDEEALLGAFFQGSPGPFEGVLDISGDCASGFAALGLVQRRETGALAAVSIGPGDEARESLIFPQFVNGEAGEPGTGRMLTNRTRLILVNPGVQPDSGTIRFRTAGGGAAFVPVNGNLTDSLPYLVAGRGTSQMTTDGTGTLQTGVVAVQPDLGEESAIAGSAILDLFGHVVSVSDSPTGKSRQAYVSFGSDENTGVALFNPDDQSPVRLEVILVSEAGNPQARTEINLAAGEQLAQFVNEARFFPAYFQSHPGPFAGTVNIGVLEGGGVSATSFLQKRSTGALVTLPVSATSYSGE